VDVLGDDVAPPLFLAASKIGTMFGCCSLPIMCASPMNMRRALRLSASSAPVEWYSLMATSRP